MEKRGITFGNVKDIGGETDGYSGAELKQIIRVVTEERFINKHNGTGTGVTKAMFREAIKSIKPIAKANKEAIDEIKDSCKRNNIRNASKK